MYLAHVLLEVLLEKRKALVIDHKQKGIFVIMYLAHVLLEVLLEKEKL